MINIAICDSEKYYQKFIQKNIASYLTKMEVSFQIDLFQSGTEFLQLGMEIIKYNIIFLDINMYGMDGIVTARKIREYSMEIYIVFITSDIKYSLEGYKVNAIRYLLKNDINLRGSIDECLSTILSQMNYSVSKILFKFTEGEKEVSINHILYIESKLHKLEFHIMEQEIAIYNTYATLNELELKLKDFSFVRVHQSFLVNIKYIKSVEAYTVTLLNNKKINIPKTRYKKVKTTFLEYKNKN